MANSKRRTRTKREPTRWNSTATQDREWSISRKIKNAVHEQTSLMEAKLFDLDAENTALSRKLEAHQRAVVKSGLVWNTVSETYSMLPAPESEPTKANLVKTATERGMLHLEAVGKLARVTAERDAALVVVKLLAGG